MRGGPYGKGGNLAGEGLAIWPNSKRDTGFLPNNALVTWPYTNLEDPRFRIRHDYMTLKQDSKIKNWFKDILELESLSPLVRLDVGETVQHEESWRLMRAEDLLRGSIDQGNKAEAIAEELQKFIKL